MQKSPFIMTAAAEDGRILLFNTATGAFASADAEVVACLEAGEGAFADALLEAGFLTPDPAADIAAQHAIFAAQRADTSTLRLCLAPTYACNCKCAYCYEADKPASWKFMSPEVEQAVYDFAAERYADTGFTTLEVEWYGGDPQLCLDLVERMAANLRAFCAERSITYTSSMLSNCTRIGELEARLIADAGVTEMLVTVDGPEAHHNLRRPTRDDIDNPFARVVEALGFLTRAGVHCTVICNSDKVNLPLIPQLQEELNPLGIPVVPAKLNDYAHSYGTGCFCGPEFDLFTHEEFHVACHDMRAQQGQLDRWTLAGMLSASCRFCNGHRNAYFIIDNVGDVYKCDGRMGDLDYRLFNLLDGSEPVLDAVSSDPTADPKCSRCNLLPLCWGNCRWEREQCGFPCHPLRTCGDAYLRDYAACFEAPTAPLHRFV